MPYDKISELPDSIKDNLPKHAQEIYRAAYNSAWEQYADPDKRRGDASREEVATRQPGRRLRRNTKRKTIAGAGNNTLGGELDPQATLRWVFYPVFAPAVRRSYRG